MPELPEVITVTKHMNNLIKGKIIKYVQINLPKMIKGISSSEFIMQVQGAKIISVFNEGKWIIIKLNNSKYIINHLRLEGKFRTEEIKGVDPKHDHVVFTFNDETKLMFNDTRQFGTFHLKGNDYKSQKPISALGKSFDELSTKWLKERLMNKRIAIKTTMLDQTIAVGLGNIYINEVLWKIKLNPNTPANELTDKQYKKLIDTSKDILDKATQMGGSSIATYSSLNGVKGEYQNELKVHGKKGDPCYRCGVKIEKEKVNGRGTYFCPSCQKIKHGRNAKLLV